MNKDKIQVGDLVTPWPRGRLTEGIGLVVSLSTIRTVKVYWFKSRRVQRVWLTYLDKIKLLSPTQEKENE